jgi:hypothetical protein
VENEKSRHRNGAKRHNYQAQTSEKLTGYNQLFDKNESNELCKMEVDSNHSSYDKGKGDYTKSNAGKDN